VCRNFLRFELRTPNRAEALHIAQLTRENERLKRRLDNAMLVIEVQKNCPP